MCARKTAQASCSVAGTTIVPAAWVDAHVARGQLLGLLARALHVAQLKRAVVSWKPSGFWLKVVDCISTLLSYLPCFLVDPHSSEAVDLTCMQHVRL